MKISTGRPAFFAALLALMVAATALVQAPPGSVDVLARYLPPGPLLVLESKDLGRLVGDWNTSREKRFWLESDNYQVFSRSKLLLRLKEVQGEFGEAAGFTPEMSLVESIAGRESVLGLYDTGRLEFLYITRLTSARAVENLLWQQRANFESRIVAGRPFYIRTDPKSGRVVAFAATDEHLLLATTENLIAKALTLMSEPGGSSVAVEPWYADSIAAQQERGDLRLVFDLEALVRTPHFRSYWIQHNVDELRQYRAGVADVHRSPTRVREERVFLRHDVEEGSGEGERAEQGNGAEAVSDTDLASVLRLVPEDAGFYRAWVHPANSQAIALLERKVLAPYAGAAPPATTAPRVNLRAQRVGFEGALETRIDQPPPTLSRERFSRDALRELLNQTGVDGLLHVQTSRDLSGVFVDNRSAAVLLGAAEWDAGAARNALRSSVEALWTTSRLGAQWVERGEAEAAYHQLDGLTPLMVAVRGRLLVVSNATALLEGVLSRMSEPVPKIVGVYAASLRHGAEREPYVKLMGHLDYAGASRYGFTGKRPPHFFSENVASLSQTLSRVGIVSVVTRDSGPLVSQTVTYELSR